MSDGRRVEPGVGGQQAGGVGEQHQQVGADQLGDQGGDAVVVAEADLVVGDGVVLVHDGHHPQLEQALAGCRGPAGTAPLHEVERGQQHLAGDEAVAAELVVRRPASAGLADGGHRLEGDGVTGPLAAAEPERGQPGGDGTRVTTTTRWPAARSAATSAQSLATAVASISPSSSVSLDVPILATSSHRRRSRAVARRCASPGPQSVLVEVELKSPITTVSPSLAPARASALSTPELLSRRWA